MKLPLSQLKKYLPLSLTPEEIAEHLTLAGMEVEKIENKNFGFSDIVVAEVQETIPHPNADNLKIATVTDGKETLTIVCGASNCRAGMKTALAKNGSSLKDRNGKIWKIKKTRLRGVESEGMLCSAIELGLSLEGEGILDLPSTATLGEDVSLLFPQPTLDVALTPNLGHCMSILGMARELSAILKLKLTLKPVSLEETGDPIEELISVSVKDTQNCPRYSCRIIQDIQVGLSPAWLQEGLEECGVRSVNNIVDATNWVMIQLGIPLHPFDYDQLHGKKIEVSSAQESSVFITLDGIERTIPKGVLFISDDREPIAIAGIMGGEKSRVSPTTKTIVLEAAYFSPQSIRASSKRLFLRTDASLRFEKGCDPNGVREALDKAAQLIAELGNGKIARGVIDHYPSPIQPKKISCRWSRVNQLLGTRFSLNEIEELLQRLDMQVHTREDNLLTVIAPTYRHDLKEEIDLVEEVIRLYGYNNIEKPLPYCLLSEIPSDPLFLFEREVRSRLLSYALQEFLTCDLISPLLAKLTLEKDLSAKNLITVLQPSSIDQSVLRTSLLPGLLQVIKFNVSHQNRNIAGFEMGKIHFKEGESFKEQSMAGIILTGHSSPHYWKDKHKLFDFFDLKGIIESVAKAFDFLNFSFAPSHFQNFHPYRQATLLLDGYPAGALGEIHPNELAAFGIEVPVYFAELNLHDLLAAKKREKKMAEIPLYPGSTRDWTVTLKEEVPIDTLFVLAKKVKSPFLEKILLLDLYKSEQIGKDRKNATLRFYYRDVNKTISLETVEKEHVNIIQELEKNL